MKRNKSLKESKTTPNDNLKGLDWEIDIIQRIRKSERKAWTICKILMAIFVLMVIGFIMLLPLKQVVPYVVMVDKLTGEASIIDTQQNFMTDTQLNDKHWIKEFVISRERYNYLLLQHDFEKVKLLAGDDPWRDYGELYLTNNPLDKQLGNDVVITPKILSISLSNNGLATVRYELSRQDKRSASPARTIRRIATLRYEYSPQKNIPENIAIDNPLGFQVTAYQTDSEFLGEN